LGRHDPDTGVDRHRLDRDEARRRFEPAIVDARGVDFSYSLSAGRRSYKIGTRRKRRPRDDGADDMEDMSGSEDESLGRKLARLKREAEEVRLELQRQEQEKCKADPDEAKDELEDDVETLSQMLYGLNASRGSENPAKSALSSKNPLSNVKNKTSQSTDQPSTLTSLASLSDRLTALEISLGLPTTTPTSSTPILPALATLTSQITTLTTTLSPPSITGPDQRTSSILNLDTLTTRVRDLTSQADRLTLSRKAATQAATDLRQARLTAAKAPTPPPPHPSSYSGSNTPHLHPNQRGTTTSTSKDQPQQETLSDLQAQSELHTKISALYTTLPRIQELSPLLPLVLDRLRSLQSIHVGAASAKADLDALEQRQEEVAGEIGKWREGLSRVEMELQRVEGRWSENGEVVEGLVKGVEARIARLEGVGST
jgi:nuclear migration protein JNM1